jgi:hypothetical protein
MTDYERLAPRNKIVYSVAFDQPPASKRIRGPYRPLRRPLAQIRPDRTGIPRHLAIPRH